MNLVFLVYVIAAFSLPAESHDIRGRIFNGQAVEDGQFKFMAFLIPEQRHCCGLIRNYDVCGGAIISPNWVLTAAHCVYGMFGINIYLGATVAEKATIAYTVTSCHFVIHSRYSKKQILNDIALIQIPKTAKCTNIDYARLPLGWETHTANTFASQNAFVLGWGRLSNNGEYPERMQKGKVQIMSMVECVVILPTINDKDVCVRTSLPLGSICGGDSGGPLVLEESGELIGIASHMSGSGCENGDPNVFMRVTSYLPWIIENIGSINL